MKNKEINNSERPWGRYYVIEDNENYKIKRIEVTNCGSGFTELPEISINTETGFNAILKPIMKFHSPEEMDVPLGTPVIQVVDCVGKFN